ncbi:MAG: hypothetical protein HY303_10605, partial [Candidatus Wallbacteria bacterium]|nr:hypothetical protein [Candidatus Wallbacteria bacterium]
MRRSLAGVLFAAALTCVPAGARDTGPTLIVAMSGDLAQGVLLRAASQAVAGAP